MEVAMKSMRGPVEMSFCLGALSSGLRSIALFHKQLSRYLTSRRKMRGGVMITV